MQLKTGPRLGMKVNKPANNALARGSSTSKMDRPSQLKIVITSILNKIALVQPTKATPHFLRILAARRR